MMLREITDQASRESAVAPESPNPIGFDISPVSCLAAARAPAPAATRTGATSCDAEDQPVTLTSMADWNSFARANREAILAEIGPVEHALAFALEGGFPLGGGAAPRFWVEVRLDEVGHG